MPYPFPLVPSLGTIVDAALFAGDGNSLTTVHAGYVGGK